MKTKTIAVPGGRFLVASDNGIELTLLMQDGESPKQCAERFIHESTAKIVAETGRIMTYQRIIESLN